VGGFGLVFEAAVEPCRKSSALPADALVWERPIQAQTPVPGLSSRTFFWKIIAVDTRSVTEAKRWIGRIVFGTLGVELATQLVNILTSATGAH